MVNNEDLLKILTEQDYKFEYAFTTLCFAILGLSIQFSPNYGRTWAPLLVVGWSFLLIAALLAGYRLVYRLVALKINYQINNNESFRSDISKNLATANYPHVRVTSPGRAMPSKEEMKMGIQKSEENIKEGNRHFEKLNSRLSYLYWVQIAAFLCGLTCNFVFVSINYLYNPKV